MASEREMDKVLVEMCEGGQWLPRGWLFYSFFFFLGDVQEMLSKISGMRIHQGRPHGGS